MSIRERLYRAEGVVLKRSEFGEADRLTTIYTLEHGKLRVLAKGVRKPRSRKAGHLEPFTRVSLLIARGRNLDLITQAEGLETFPALKEDLEKLSQASYVVEMLDRLAYEEGEENRALYQLFVDTLRRLEAGQVNAQSVLLYFELGLLDRVGYRPELFRCLGCDSEIRPEHQFFSLQLGGLICPQCGRGSREHQPISLPALKVMRHYQRNHFEQASKAHVRGVVFEEIESIMEAYMTYLLERRLNAPAFIRHLKGFSEGRPRVKGQPNK
jgi:DNA repair protein RecO (recombination protein O)